MINKRTYWKYRYEWSRLRVVIEEFTGDAWDQDDGRTLWLSEMNTGRSFSLRVWTFWRRRREIFRDRKLPKMQLLP